MIFTEEGSKLVDVETDRKHMKWTWGKDISEHWNMCYQLRTYDEQNGMSQERTMQHIASLDEITYGVLITTKPEVLQSVKEFRKWLKTEEGQLCRVSRDATPIRGDSLQLIIR